MSKSIFKLFTIFSLFILMSSCTKDPETGLIGTWSTSDGGTITFNSDGTGTTADSDFFLWDCGTLTINGQSEYFGPVTAFEWQINTNDSNDNLFMSFDDQTSFSQPCSGTMEFPVTVQSAKKAKVGATVLGFGLEVELTK